MTHELEHYPRALVPEHLVKLTIANLPLNSVYYVPPGNHDDWEPPAIFVDSKRRLRMNTEYVIEPAHRKRTAKRIGRVGVMRSVVVNQETGDLSTAYVADLRGIGDHALVDMFGLDRTMDDTEEWMKGYSSIEKSVVFDGFMAYESRTEPRQTDQEAGLKPKKPKLAIYGGELVKDAFEYILKLEETEEAETNKPDAKKSSPKPKSKKR